jgi:hypothetical protein
VTPQRAIEPRQYGPRQKERAPQAHGLGSVKKESLPIITEEDSVFEEGSRRLNPRVHSSLSNSNLTFRFGPKLSREGQTSFPSQGKKTDNGFAQTRSGSVATQEIHCLLRAQEKGLSEVSADEPNCRWENSDLKPMSDDESNEPLSSKYCPLSINH